MNTNSQIKIRVLVLILISFLGCSEKKQTEKENSLDSPKLEEFYMTHTTKHEQNSIHARLAWQGSLNDEVKTRKRDILGRSKLNTIGDITGDGTAELIHLDGEWNKQEIAFNGYIKIFQWKNKELILLWTSQKIYSDVTSLAAGDINNNNRDEVIIGLKRKVLIFEWNGDSLTLNNTLDFFARKVSITIEPEAEEAWKKPMNIDPGVIGNLTVGTLSKSDGKAILVLTCLDSLEINPLSAIGEYHLEGYSVSEEKINRIPNIIGTISSWMTPPRLLLGDINNDNVTELIVTTFGSDWSDIGALFYDLDADEYHYKKIIFDSGVMLPVAVVDIDGDNKNDLITSGSNYTLQVLHAIQIYKWQDEYFSFFKPIKTKSLEYRSEFVWIGDLSGDEKFEMVIIDKDYCTVYELY